MESLLGPYRITDDASSLNVDTVCDLLAATYWAGHRPREKIEKSIQHSICISVLLEDKQVGFARVVTDRAVFAWIADVVVAPEHRGKGLGKAIVQFIQDHPEIPSSRQLLGTRDAHGLYEKFGFRPYDAMSK